VIEQPNPLSLTPQCELLGLSSAALYYRPVEVSPDELELMALIDGQYPRAVLRFSADDRLASNARPFHNETRASELFRDCPTSHALPAKIKTVATKRMWRWRSAPAK
jgi:hypothetical protein